MQVTESFKSVYGHEHINTLTSMNNLASIYMRQRRWTEAEELVMHVAEKLKMVLGELHPQTLIAMSNLSIIHDNQGRWNDAEELQVQVVDGRQKVFGQDHPFTIAATRCLLRLREAHPTRRHLVRVDESVNTLQSLLHQLAPSRSSGGSKERSQRPLEIVQECDQDNLRTNDEAHEPTATEVSLEGEDDARTFEDRFMRALEMYLEGNNNGNVEN